VYRAHGLSVRKYPVTVIGLPQACLQRLRAGQGFAGDADGLAGIGAGPDGVDSGPDGISSGL